MKESVCFWIETMHVFTWNESRTKCSNKNQGAVLAQSQEDALLEHIAKHPILNGNYYWLGADIAQGFIWGIDL